MAGRGKPPVVDEDADCVTQVELRAFTYNIIEVINVNHARYATTLEGIERKISGVPIGLRLWRFVYLLLHMNSMATNKTRVQDVMRSYNIACTTIIKVWEVTMITIMITATRITVILLPRLNLLSLLSVVLMMLKFI
jgi:hypothetical protein